MATDRPDHRPTFRSHMHVHLLVTWKGEVYWDHIAHCRLLHEANFVVVEHGPQLQVWKDRFGDNKDRVVNAQWAGIRAAQHLRWIQANEESHAIHRAWGESVQRVNALTDELERPLEVQP